MQLVFVILVLVHLVILIPFIMIGSSYLKTIMADAPSGYQYPRVTDLATPAFLAIFFAVLERLSTMYVGSLFGSVCKDQEDEVKLQIRKEKVGKHFFGFLYKV